MSVDAKAEEVRWQVVKAMLDEFPALKVKIKYYLKEQKSKR